MRMHVMCVKFHTEAAQSTSPGRLSQEHPWSVGHAFRLELSDSEHVHPSFVPLEYPAHSRSALPLALHFLHSLHQGFGQAHFFS